MMDFLWTDYNPLNTYSVENEIQSPCLEIQRVARTPRGADIEVNALIRFAEIFVPLFESIDDEDVRHQLENIVCHYLAQLDLQSSIHRFTLEEDAIRHDLECGSYGERVKQNFDRLDESDKRKVCSLLRRQDASNETELLFQEAIFSLFDEPKIYYYNDENRFLICLTEEENDCAKVKLSLIDELFFDLFNRETKVFWNNHFGIIGKPATMRLDDVILY